MRTALTKGFKLIELSNSTERNNKLRFTYLVCGSMCVYSRACPTKWLKTADNEEITALSPYV